MAAPGVEDHIKRVNWKIAQVADELIQRALHHDDSKLIDPELLGWEAMDKEPRQQYGTDAYFEKLERFSFVLNHHYSVNRHHPEHFPNGWKGMDLVDLIEMLCDWLSYKPTLYRREVRTAIAKQCERFEIPKYLEDLLVHTAVNYLCNDSEKDLNKSFEQNSNKYADILMNHTLKQVGLERKDVPQANDGASITFDDLFDVSIIDIKALNKFGLD